MVLVTDYFDRVLSLKRQISIAISRVDRCRDMTQKITVTLTADVVSHSRNVTSNEEAIIRLVEAEDALKELNRQYNDLIAMVYTDLSKLSDEICAKVLCYYYIDQMSFDKIAIKMHIAKTSVRRYHKQGLDEFQKVLNIAEEKAS